MYVSQKPMWKLGALQAEGAVRMRNRDDLSTEYPIYCSYESYIILLSDRRRPKWKSRGQQRIMIRNSQRENKLLVWGKMEVRCHGRVLLDNGMFWDLFSFLTFRPLSQCHDHTSLYSFSLNLSSDQYIQPLTWYLHLMSSSYQNKMAKYNSWLCLPNLDLPQSSNLLKGITIHLVFQAKKLGNSLKFSLSTPLGPIHQQISSTSKMYPKSGHLPPSHHYHLWPGLPPGPALNQSPCFFCTWPPPLILLSIGKSEWSHLKPFNDFP